MLRLNISICGWDLDNLVIPAATVLHTRAIVFVVLAAVLHAFRSSARHPEIVQNAVVVWTRVCADPYAVLVLVIELAAVTLQHAVAIINKATAIGYTNAVIVAICVLDV